MNGPPNGYVNGRDPSRSRYLFELDASSLENSADERSRSRGNPTRGAYGRPPAASGRPTPGQQHGLSGLDAQYALPRSRGENDWNHSRSRSRAGARYGAAGNQIEDILRDIEQHWAFMASDRCVPVKVALQLMDPSSLGLADQRDRFFAAHGHLQTALKVIVNEHHQGFNSSIGTFHKIQAAILASQHRVRTLKAGLIEAKATLGQSKPELRALVASSQTYDGMLQTFATIEELQLVPERLESQISEKRFLCAVDTLLEGLAMVRRTEMEEIGALSELRVYLSNQEHSLTDILIEELHSHLYLKSPYCEERWKVHLKRNESSHPATLDSGERGMHLFLDGYDGSVRMQEDTTRNPEADTFYYIQLLVESLERMGSLETAINATIERLPTEMFKAHDKTLDEIEQRHPSTMRNAVSRKRPQSIAFHAGPEGEKKAMLEDLLHTLYAKLEAIAEGHRVLHDVTGAILRREQSTERLVLNRTFRELWSLLQNEMRSLLHDYVATSGNLGGRFRKQNNASANIFQPHARDRNKRMFRLTDTLSDGKHTDLATEREDLEFMFKASVPGLVNANSISAASKPDEAALDRSGTGHKLLVEPSVFNMSILLPPSLAFLTQLRHIVPPLSSVARGPLTNFLDDFLLNVFYPQLDETLLDLCSRSMNDLDTFQPHLQWPTLSQKPIFRGTARFFELIEAFCQMLDGLPHDQSFSRLVITQMQKYYARCRQWSKGLLQHVQMAEGAAPGLRLAADLATTSPTKPSPVKDVVIQLLEVSGPELSVVLAEKESELLLQIIKHRKLEESDLINDSKAIAALCTLHVSMKWLVARCGNLRYISPRTVDTSRSESHHQRRWSHHLHPSTASEPATPFLPLDYKTAEEFDSVLASFTDLSVLILHTLQIDLRLHLLNGVYKALDTTYALGQPYNEPDPAILSLSTSLSTYATQLNTHLLPRQNAYLTSGLHITVNRALTSLVSSIPAMDAHGNARMALNILVLQQSLKNIQSDADLNDAARFYELGGQGPMAILEKGVKEGYAPADLKALMRLSWVEERDEGLEDLETLVARL